VFVFNLMPILPFHLNQLLGSPSSPAIPYRIYTKSGRVFALIPDRPSAHRLFIKRLPAHSTKAKLSRLGFAWWHRFFLPCVFGSSVRIPVDPKNPLVQFLSSMNGTPVEAQTAPLFLPGNPEGEAPRLVIICRNRKGLPQSVVKVGMTPKAVELIKKESGFLENPSPAASPLLPSWLGLHEEKERGLAAFAAGYVEGRSPHPLMIPGFQDLFHAWIDKESTCSVASLPLWNRLCQAVYEDRSVLPESVHDLGGRCIHPVLYHGDFAPWNILWDRSDHLRIIDWERVERSGMPGWDWLHFEIQTAILLKKWSAPEVRAYGKRIAQSPEFLEYLARAFPTSTASELPEIAGSILDGYFLYNWYIFLNRENHEK